MVQFATIDRALINTLTACLVIARYGVGVDMVDIDAATEMGIPVANVPHYCIDEVSSQTVGFVLDLNRRTLALAAHVRAGRWGAASPVTPPSRLRGQVLGVVGFGAIGSEVARKAQALGLEIVAYDPFAVADRHPGISFVSLTQLLAQSDYVSLHCPLTDSTRGLIGTAELAQMKPSAYLLNLSRGPVVDQSALTHALRTGVIQGAALDVLATEPPDPTDPLLQLDNVIVTPHIASWSIEAGIELRREVAQSVVDALQGREPVRGEPQPATGSRARLATSREPRLVFDISHASAQVVLRMGRRLIEHSPSGRRRRQRLTPRTQRGCAKSP